MWNLPEQEKGVHQGFQRREEGEDDPVHHPLDVVPHVLRLHRLKQVHPWNNKSNEVQVFYCRQH
jgi:hypothetical protein